MHNIKELREEIYNNKIKDCMILTEKELIKRLVAGENQSDMLTVLSSQRKISKLYMHLLIVTISIIYTQKGKITD